jgi:NADH dehydrogenase/NADH:ubiquinone oxidoreductase subunit G
MNMPARWCAAGIAVVLAASLAASAAEPVIDIPNEAALGALQDTQRQQIDAYVAYQVDKMAKATSQDEVIAARRKLTDIYNRYGSKAQEFMSAFGASMAKHGKAMLAGLAADDPLRILKEVNLSLTVSRMGQVTLGPLADVMVSHADPAVRHFGWTAYAAMRGPVMAAGGKAAQAMYDVLSNRLQKETNPQVLAEMVKMFTFRDIAEAGGAITPEAYSEGLSKLFKILEANWVSLCRRVMLADGSVAEAASTAVDAAVRLKNELKGKVADQVAIQLVANMTWSAGKAFDLALGAQDAAEAARLADKTTDKAGENPIDENPPAAKPAVGNAPQPAPKVGKDAKTLGSRAVGAASQPAPKVGRDAKTLSLQAAQNEYAVSTITKLLQDCESSLNALTQRNETYISKPLGATGGDRAAAVRLGAGKWIDELVKAVNIKRPEDVVPPKAAPAPK